MAYDLITDLDDWADGVATACGLFVTRDPKYVNPKPDQPVVYLDMPDAVGVTLAAISMAQPVWLVAGGGGKQAADQLLEHLPAVLAAVESSNATAQELDLNDGRRFEAYRITTNLHITEETP